MVNSMEKFLKKVDLQTVSMQTLAFIGDAVYNVYIRTYLASKSNEKPGKLHKESICFVSAKSQAKTIDKIMTALTQEEIDVYKRGRNTSVNSITKHADIVEYKKATGFEALIGYLFVKKDEKRLEEIIHNCIESMTNES